MTLSGVRALVLAAGHGQRLRPLTDQLPKPLIPVCGRPLLAHTLARLEKEGIAATAINLHHLDTAIPQRFGTAFGKLSLTYSLEAVLRGTLGALVPLRDFLAGAEAILVINGDSLCAWPVRRLLRLHYRRRAAATLLFSSRADPSRYGGGVAIDGQQRVQAFHHARPGSVKRRLVFAGAHVISPRLLTRLPERPADFVNDLYEPLLAAGGHLEAVVTRRPWHDLGTPDRYLAATLDWCHQHYPWRLGRWLAPGVERGARTRLSRVVVEEGVRIAPGCRLTRCVLLPGARIGADCRLRDVVVGPGTRVPSGTRVEARLLTAHRADSAPPAGSSRLGELVLTPLG